MGNIPLEHGLIVATILFALGFYGVMVRRNLLFILILTLAAAEACIGLAIVLQFYHRFHHLDVDAASEMRG